jgi:hypothetical protein
MNCIKLCQVHHIKLDSAIIKEYLNKISGTRSKCSKIRRLHQVITNWCDHSIIINRDQGPSIFLFWYCCIIFIDGLDAEEDEDIEPEIQIILGTVQLFTCNQKKPATFQEGESRVIRRSSWEICGNSGSSEDLGSSLSIESS